MFERMKLGREALAHDGLFWRRIAAWGAQSGPEWWVKYSPAFFGLAGAVLVPSARRKVVANLRRIRGETSVLRNAVETGQTFTTYAGCLAEVLSNGSKNGRVPQAELIGRERVLEVAALKKGIVVVTIHTGGWETVGPLFSRIGLRVMMAMEPERDPRARELQDEARRAAGLLVAHVGGDPLDSLPLLRHLQTGGVVALQVDRLPPGIRTESVRLLGAPGEIPLGPLRLAQLSGAPLVPIFCAREGYRRYRLEASPPIFLPRRASRDEVHDAAQKVADAVTAFLRVHPTQWFHFGDY
ncbi:lysophospholipid acyltransferase family protein [Pendulispora albinea]|uniref:Lysophospholipid acyltransferase family protein n=1 Tax=Pendulispora albinea TaxID=2741071 RepID=A0ABZ2M6L1_9BACT